MVAEVGHTFRVQILAEGYVPEYWNDVAELEDAADIRLTSARPSRSGVDARLARVGSISGTVVDHEGKPVTNALVAAYDGRNKAVASAPTIGPTARFEITGLPPDAYRVRVQLYTPEDYRLAPEWFHDRYDFASATPVVVGPGEAVDGIVAELGPGGRILGRVRPGPGGPDPGFWTIGVLQRDGDDWVPVRQLWAAEDGSYEIEGLGTGDYRVLADGLTYYPGVTDPGQATTVHVVAGETVRGIDFAVPPAGKISGRVLSERGAPLSGAEVWLYTKQGQSWARSGDVLAGANGEYVFPNLTPGAYRIRFGGHLTDYQHEFWPDARSLGSGRDIVLGPSEQRTGIDGRLAPASVIRGRVATTSGAPIGGIGVTAYLKTSTGYKHYASAASAGDGSYRVTGLTEGRYRLSFGDHRPGSAYYSTEYWNQRGGAESLSGAADIVVPRSSTRSGVNARLERGATISGRALSESPFLLVQRIRIYQLTSGRWRQHSVASVPASGRFSVRLDAGRYRLGLLSTVDDKVVEFWKDARSLAKARVIKLSPGSHVTDVNFATKGALPPDEVGLGRSLNLTGRPVVGETLRLDEVLLSPDDASVSYQWYLDDQKVSGATSPSLRVQQHMIGRQVALLVTGTKAGWRPLRTLIVAGTPAS